MTEEMLFAVARNEETLRILRDLGIGALITVPLAARGQILGAITFVASQAGHQYTEEDLVLAEDLTARCALAIENARLYSKLQENVRLRDRVLGYVSHDLKNPLSIIALSAFDALYPPGMQWYWKGDFVRELSDEAIAEHVRFAEVPTMHSTMHLYPINGAVHRVGEDETAWSYRDTTWSMVIAGVDPDPGKAGPITTWARSYWEALHPYSAGGAYLNFMMEEGQDRIKATYRGNYERLARIKAKYDPENRFRVNQNIEPAE